MKALLQTRRNRQAFLYVPCSTVRCSANRLDASSYCGRSAATRQLIADGTIKADRLGNLAAVTQPTVFGKRFMMGTQEQGIPLYASGELLNHEPTTDAYISRRHTESVRELFAESGALLFTRSGSVGRVVLTPPWLDGACIQDDVLKVIPENRQLAYYLYIYFQGPIGQPLLTDAAFGSVIQHIKVDHVRELPVFRVSPPTEAAIARRVESAVELRVQAHKLLQEAKNRCLRDNNLPPLSQSVPGWLPKDKRQVAFTIPSSILKFSPGTQSEIRLEAHFHNPVAQEALNHISRCPSRKRPVAAITARLFFCNRFTRTFVDEAHGIPYLAGKNIIQIRPKTEHFLSITETDELSEYKVRRSWILLTCSGTIGRTAFVWKNFEKFVATHDLIRVVANENEVDPGYLHAFLSSPYGYEQILRYRHGSVIDHVTPDQVGDVIIPLPTPTQQQAIGDLVRDAYDKRAEALKLEDEAQELLLRELKRNTNPEN